MFFVYARLLLIAFLFLCFVWFFIKLAKKIWYKESIKMKIEDSEARIKITTEQAEKLITNITNLLN